MNAKTTAEKIANLKTRTAKLRKQNRKIRENIARRKAAGDDDFTAAIRAAIAPPCQRDTEVLDIRPASPMTKGEMNVSPPSINRICDAYQVSRQRLHEMRRKYDLSPADFQKPDLVLAVLIESAPASPMRSRLVDPAERLRITQLLS